jgi:hypothetical protein
MCVYIQYVCIHTYVCVCVCVCVYTHTHTPTHTHPHTNTHTHTHTHTHSTKTARHATPQDTKPSPLHTHTTPMVPAETTTHCDYRCHHTRGPRRQIRESFHAHIWPPRCHNSAPQADPYIYIWMYVGHFMPTYGPHAAIIPRRRLIPIHIYMDVCTYIHTYRCVYVCMCICMYVCVCIIHTHTHKHTHTHTHTVCVCVCVLCVYINPPLPHTSTHTHTPCVEGLLEDAGRNEDTVDLAVVVTIYIRGR